MAGSKSLFLWNVLWGTDNKLDTLNTKIDALSNPVAKRAILTSSGSFVVPAPLIFVTAIASGGNGSPGAPGKPTEAGVAGPGGAVGDHCIRIPFMVTVGSSIDIIVGDGNTVVGTLVSLLKGGGKRISEHSLFADFSGTMTGGTFLGAKVTNLIVGGAAGKNGDGGAGGKGNSGGGGAGVPIFPGAKGGDGGFTGGQSVAGTPGGNAIGFGAAGGGGGGGGQIYSYTPAGGAGGAGAPGIVIIEW